MTSTEFTVGLDGSRVSSKVLKPPGGGSSDIFGLGNSHASTNGVMTEKTKNSQDPTNSKERLFGCSNNTPSSRVKTHQMQSNVFGNNELPSKPARKKFVHRNPITGEEIEIDPEKSQKTENDEVIEEKKDEVNEEKKDEVNEEKSDEVNGEKNAEVNGEKNAEVNGEKNEVNEEEKTDEAQSVPVRPLQTSIRVRNPPGGKSSGIF